MRFGYETLSKIKASCSVKNSEVLVFRGAWDFYIVKAERVREAGYHGTFAEIPLRL